MVAKIIKEIVLILLTCLLAILLFAIVLYEYVPNRKVVPEVTEYTAPPKVEEQLADDIENKKDDVVLTYEVTSSDLNNYKITNEYVPGKANPFEEYTENTTESDENDAKVGEGSNNEPSKSTESGKLVEQNSSSEPTTK